MLQINPSQTLINYRIACLEIRPSKIVTSLAFNARFFLLVYSGACILRPPLQPPKHGPNWEVVLKWKDIYSESIRMVSLIAGLKMQGIVKWRWS